MDLVAVWNTVYTREMLKKRQVDRNTVNENDV
jgi:hypothetical protein